ncbi:threonine dehydratase [Opitutus terrae]|uniref:Pyridoxal-5'-phosphate-dependent protein beta subunit n=1 Tax=Opitutus terrae (strain DSM 11246 / JCM 15787 / PB90-1) TaxID=452637 RepID=B1ZUH6_OPITP|nr:threonine dehydratase [Opitutus terrae]ACB74019.1 Pyridoxal-5'-phosphate-dependent protein beta subunit [Opitutus terrae PB90-1]
MPPLPSLAEIESAAALVRPVVPSTPQYSWPLLNARAGCEVWVKHENHAPLGAFKVRGGLVYFDRLRQREPALCGVIAATRGNHGQSVAFAAGRYGFSATIVVPRGNNPEKNSAMRALGAELVEHGEDFQAALEHARRLAAGRELHLVPSFHRDLVCGVAVSALDFLRQAPPLDAVYVPIGLGSGICAMIAARDALGWTTPIIGVAADRAPAVALSFAAGQIVTHPSTTLLADGLACSTPNAEAFPHILRGVAGVVRVTEEEIAAALRAAFSDTHNAIEGAAAAALAALLQEKDRRAGKRVGVVFTGGNIDSALLAQVLAAA